MSKSFDKVRVSSPAISVRISTGNASFVRPNYARTSRTPAKRAPRNSRSWAKSIRTALTFGVGTRQLAVYGLLGIFGVLVISHIFLINSSAAKGYEMKNIQNAIADQTDIEHNLEVKAAELSSMSSIDETAQNNRLVSITNEEFLAPATVTALQTTK